MILDGVSIERLVAELMPISVAVGGPGARALADQLAATGTIAEAPSHPAEDEFDLAILLVANSDSALEQAGVTLRTLRQASPRLLFLPPPNADSAGHGLPELTAWFELFADHGYQPVVDYDASYLSPGAFLLDREAIAAEADLAGFAQRLSGAPAAAPPPRTPDDRPELASLRAEAAECHAAIAELRERLAAAQAARDAEAARAEAHARTMAGLLDAQAEANAARAGENAGWDAIRHWLRDAVAQLPNTPDALREAAARLGAPWPAPPRAIRRWWRPRSGPRSGPDAQAELARQVAAVRASKLFDAAWYVASNPELATGALDPALHYVLTGAASGADPGPWFDTQRYRLDVPQSANTALPPLVYAIDHGDAARMAADL